MGQSNEEDEEEFDQHSELQEAVLLLCRAVECLGDLISKEMDAVKKRDTSEKAAEGEKGGGGGGVDKVDGDTASLNRDEGSDDDDDDDDGEGMSGRGGIIETLALQLAGVLHKLVQGMCVVCRVLTVHQIGRAKSIVKRKSLTDIACLPACQPTCLLV